MKGSGRPCPFKVLIQNLFRGSFKMSDSLDVVWIEGYPPAKEDKSVVAVHSGVRLPPPPPHTLKLSSVLSQVIARTRDSLYSRSISQPYTKWTINSVDGSNVWTLNTAARV